MTKPDFGFEDLIHLSDLFRARQSIAPHVRRTPLSFSPSLSDATKAEVWLKLENLQVTGSFKLRGAVNRMLQLDDAEKKRGVVAVSSGNHGRAVAYFAARMGIKATICLSSLVPSNKIDAIKSYGAEVKIVGDSQDDAQIEADRLVEEQGLVWIAPYDDLRVIAGQGTIALEVVEDLPEVNMIVAPLSGGGLVSGIAIGMKQIDRRIRVVGASMDCEAGMVQSLKAGRPVTVGEGPSLADALGGSIGLSNRFTLPIVQAYMDQAALISEDELVPAMQLMFRGEGMVIEGGSAVAVAALFGGKIPCMAGKKIACVITGRNIDPERFEAAVARDVRAA